jgi:hypothetical protein
MVRIAGTLLCCFSTRIGSYLELTHVSPKSLEDTPNPQLDASYIVVFETIPVMPHLPIPHYK